MSDEKCCLLIQGVESLLLYYFKSYFEPVRSLVNWCSGKSDRGVGYKVIVSYFFWGGGLVKMDFS